MQREKNGWVFKDLVGFVRGDPTVGSSSNLKPPKKIGDVKFVPSMLKLNFRFSGCEKNNQPQKTPP